MQRHHKDLAVMCGVEKDNVLILDNGDIAAINKDGLRLAGQVASGEVYIDGTGIGDIGSQVIKERKVLSEEGLFSVIVSYSKKDQKLISPPTIISRGFIYMKGNEAITNNLSSEVEHLMLQALNKKMFNEALTKQSITEHLSQIIHKLTLRKPMIIPILIDIS
jgi:ribonuclease J